MRDSTSDVDPDVDPELGNGLDPDHDTGVTSTGHETTGLRWTGRDWLALAGVFIVYGVAALLLFPGPHPGDPSYYFQSAVNWPHIPADYWTLRIGLVAPVTALVHLFGPSEITLYALPTAATLLLAAAVFATMRLLVSDRLVAAAAAATMVLVPGYLLNAFYIFPDTLATATFAAGFLAVLHARPRHDSPDVRWATPTAVVAGVLFGLTYLIREFSPILAPAVVAALFLLHYDRRRICWLAAGFIATLAVEPIYGAVKYGDAFAHLHTLMRGTGEGAHHAMWAPFRRQVHNPVDAALVLPRLLLSWRSGWILVVLMGVFVLALLIVRDRRLTLLGIWFFSYWAIMIVFALVRNSHGDPLVNVGNVRYWAPLLPPMVMGGIGGAALLIRGREPGLRRVRFAQAAALALAAVTVIPGSVEFSSCASHDIWRNEPQQRWVEVRSWLQTSTAQHYDLMWAANPSRRLLTVFTRSTFGHRLWPGQVQPIPRLGTPTPTQDPASLVLVDWRRDSARRVADLRRNAWTPIFVTRDGVIAVLAQSGQGRPVSAADEVRWMSAIGPRDLTPGSCGLSPYEAG
ncbi:MAG: hypothetical protein QOJ03_3286 [Frankiaceae bacterium]|nr:hypothetical protein [Frankiaceae bacterium]